MCTGSRQEWYAQLAQEKNEKEVEMFWEAVRHNQLAGVYRRGLSNSKEGRGRWRGELREERNLFGDESEPREEDGIDFELYKDVIVERSGGDGIAELLDLQDLDG